MIQAYKLSHELTRLPVQKFFKPVFSNTRGHSRKFFKEHASKRQRANFFSRRIINEWNGLPPEVVDAPSIDLFKRRLDEHWNEIRFKTR